MGKDQPGDVGHLQKPGSMRDPCPLFAEPKNSFEVPSGQREGCKSSNNAGMSSEETSRRVDYADEV